MTIFQLAFEIWKVAGMRVLLESRPGVLDSRIDVRVAHIRTAEPGVYTEVPENEPIGDYQAVILSPGSMREQ